MEFGNLTNLFDLNLAYNNLEGNIPKELGNMSNLVYLEFWSNNLSGTIPE
jgi:Leucine-rich repeat (LRR) protein